MIGQTISHYRIIEKLGAGGMGEVFKAEDLKLGRIVALKFLPAALSNDPLSVDRLRREARSASILNHPGICTIHAIDEHDGHHFIVMELLDGRPLDDVLRAGPLPIPQVITYALEIADALDAAHSRGIVHRDIKPGNIFVTRRDRIKLVDFGLVKVTGAGSGSGEALTAANDVLATTPGMTVGTIAYMSPEQARGEEIDARTDLFSFGLVIYEMATGRRAFQGSSSAVIFDAILNRAPLPATGINPAIPPDLDRVLARALEKDRRLRYQTAADLAADLHRLERDRQSGRVAAAGGSAYVPSGAPPLSASGSSLSPAAPAAASVAGMSQSGPLTPGSSASGTPGVAGSEVHVPPSSPLAAAGASGPALSPLPALAAGALKGAPAAGLGASGVPRAALLGAAALILVLVAAVAYLWGRMAEYSSRQAPVERSATTSAPGAGPAPTAPAAATSPPSTPGPSTSASPAAAATPAAIAAGGGAVAPGSAGDRPVPPAGKTKAAAPIGKSEAVPVAAALDAELRQRLEAARARIDQRLPAQAIADLRALVEKHPAHALTPDAYMLIGQAYEAQNQPEEAMATYVEMHVRFRTHPQAPEALFRLAQWIQRSRRPDRDVAAIKVFGQIAEEYPESPWSARALGARAALEERDRERLLDEVTGVRVPKAALTYRQIAQRYPSQSEEALWKLAGIYDDLDRYPLAAQALVDLTTRFPETKYDAWYRLGELYEKRLKDRPKAADAYARVPPSSSNYRDAQRKAMSLSSGR